MIRNAEKKDIPDLHRLLLQVNNVHAAGRPDLFVKDRTKYTVAELEVILADEKRIVYVYENDEGKICGYAFCDVICYENNNNLTDRTELYIDDICVDESCRGQHIGTNLYRYTEKKAKEQGFYRLTLNVWSLNPAAQAFYRSLGMTEYKIGMEQIL